MTYEPNHLPPFTNMNYKKIDSNTCEDVKKALIVTFYDSEDRYDNYQYNSGKYIIFDEEDKVLKLTEVLESCIKVHPETKEETRSFPKEKVDEIITFCIDKFDDWRQEYMFWDIEKEWHVGINYGYCALRWDSGGHPDMITSRSIKSANKT